MLFTKKISFIALVVLSFVLVVSTAFAAVSPITMDAWRQVLTNFHEGTDGGFGGTTNTEVLVNSSVREKFDVLWGSDSKLTTDTTIPFGENVYFWVVEDLTSDPVEANTIEEVKKILENVEEKTDGFGGTLTKAWKVTATARQNMDILYNSDAALSADTIVPKKAYVFIREKEDLTADAVEAITLTDLRAIVTLEEGDDGGYGGNLTKAWKVTADTLKCLKVLYKSNNGLTEPTTIPKKAYVYVYELRSVNAKDITMAELDQYGTREEISSDVWVKYTPDIDVAFNSADVLVRTATTADVKASAVNEGVILAGSTVEIAAAADYKAIRIEGKDQLFDLGTVEFEKVTEPRWVGKVDNYFVTLFGDWSANYDRKIEKKTITENGEKKEVDVEMGIVVLYGSDDPVEQGTAIPVEAEIYVSVPQYLDSGNSNSGGDTGVSNGGGGGGGCETGFGGWAMLLLAGVFAARRSRSN